jgi:Ca2+-binding RTX toxin-like protein
LPISFTNSWRRCNPTGDLSTCVEIPGATGSSYVPTTADIGFAIRVWVTGTNTQGSDVVITNHTYPIVDKPHFAPRVSTPPAIKGTFEVGRELMTDVSAASFDGDAPITTAVVWQRCDAVGTGCRTIVGAGKGTYTPTLADVGYRLRVAVTAANPYGATTTLSDPSDPIIATPPHHEGRDIVGTSTVDYLAGGGWDDTIVGLAGNDTLLGGAGGDKLDGGDGNDVLFGGAGVDTLLGGAGSDTIYAADGERDVVDCGPGSDRALVDAFDKVAHCEVVERTP